MTSHTYYNTNPREAEGCNETDAIQETVEQQNSSLFLSVVVMSLNTCFKKGTAASIINTVIKR